MKNTFELKFRVDGSAYRNDDGSINFEAIANSLRNCANGIENGLKSGYVIDFNGNNVGQWKIIGEN